MTNIYTHSIGLWRGLLGSKFYKTQSYGQRRIGVQPRGSVFDSRLTFLLGFISKKISGTVYPERFNICKYLGLAYAW
jgi:hypothetical protein